MATVKVEDGDFKSTVLESDLPVVVDYWAEWCGPCKMISAALEEISDELSGKVTIAKMNVDDNPNTPSQYGVKGLPTLMVFKKGEVVATKLGGLPKSQLSDWVNANV